MLGRGVSAFGEGREEGGHHQGGVIAILQLLLAAEIIETDLRQQYRELGGVEATWPASSSIPVSPCRLQKRSSSCNGMQIKSISALPTTAKS
jgi:hypothetical protein